MNLSPNIYRSFLESNFTIKKTSDSKEVRICSPFCDDKKYHLYFNLENGLWSDFKTSSSGNINDLVSYYLDIPKNQVIYYLLENYDSNYKKDEETFEPTISSNFDELLKNTKWFKNNNLGIFGKQALKYLQRRKVAEEYILQWGYVFEPGYEFDRRIVIPWIEDGKIVFATTRAIDKNVELRYKNPTGLDSKEFVFNYDKINDNPLCICEGVFDAISVPNVSTCLMSADIGVKQINKIAEKGVKKIIWMPDNDETGKFTLKRNINKVMLNYPPSLDLTNYIFEIPKPYKDFNEYAINTNLSSLPLDKIKIFSNNDVSLEFDFNKKKKAF